MRTGCEKESGKKRNAFFPFPLLASFLLFFFTKTVEALTGFFPVLHLLSSPCPALLICSIFCVLASPPSPFTRPGSRLPPHKQITEDAIRRIARDGDSEERKDTIADQGVTNVHRKAQFHRSTENALPCTSNFACARQIKTALPARCTRALPSAVWRCRPCARCAAHQVPPLLCPCTRPLARKMV